MDVLVRCEQLEADAQDLDSLVLLAATRGGQVALPDQRVLPSHPVGWGQRLHTLDPRGTARWKKLYRQCGAVERENGQRQNEWALLPLRVRRLKRVQLHADLTILARWLACALAEARADTA